MIWNKKWGVFGLFSCWLLIQRDVGCCHRNWIEKNRWKKKSAVFSQEFKVSPEQGLCLRTWLLAPWGDAAPWACDRWTPSWWKPPRWLNPSTPGWAERWSAAWCPACGHTPPWSAARICDYHPGREGRNTCGCDKLEWWQDFFFLAKVRTHTSKNLI